MQQPQNVLYEVNLSDKNDVAVRSDLNFDQVRSAVGSASIMMLFPGLAHLFENQTDLILAAARSGLLIDVGHLPDAAIRTIGKRGSDLTFERAYDHPWGARPWLLTHTWASDADTEFDDSWHEPEDRERVAAMRASRLEQNRITTHLYLIEPRSTETRFGATVTEYAFATLRNGPKKVKFFLLPFARVTLDHGSKETYRAVVEGPDYAINPGTAGSALNPMMTALLLLNTRGVATETIAPPKITNAAREKKGRGPIPGYTRVLSTDYVTTVLAKPRHKTGAARGGESDEKRRSPIAHLRRGHIRTYGDGDQIWIRDMLVGVKHEDELSFVERHRAGYRVQQA
jgi:hypothetical protein